MKLKIYIAIILLSLITQDALVSQQNDNNAANSKREEVQRYFGYEALLPGYLTLPIDVSTNTNERGYFVEIGFLLLILVPIILLWRLRSKYKLLSGIFILICLLVQVLYVSSSFVLSGASQKIGHGSITTYLNGNNENVDIIDKILGPIYIGLNNLGAPILELTNRISGHSDYITYPILVLLFIGLLVILNRVDVSKKNKVLLNFSLVFSFFWLILSSGIIWYGYLLFPLLFIVIFASKNSINMKALNYSVMSLTVIWLVIAFTTRVSFISINANFNKDNAGKFLMNSIFFSRSVGSISSQEVIDKAHPNLTAIQNQINRESNSLVLRVGTTLGYFIENNGDRILQDNQLSFFDMFHTKYQSKQRITKALKLGGFKYLMVDLNTHTLDRTPEQTLTSKFRKLLNFVSGNSQLRLMGTDRIIQTNKNGTPTRQYGLSGNIVYGGSYAVFEIL